MPFGEDTVKFGGPVLGAVGTIISIISAIRGKDRYDTIVSLAPGTREWMKDILSVAATNSGNKPFYIVRAYYRTGVPSYEDEADRPTDRLGDVTFFVPAAAGW